MCIRDSGKEMQALLNIVNSNQFEVIADWMKPMPTQGLNSVANAGLLPIGSTLANIQINGSNNFVRVKGDSVSANLPFYGERRFGGGYNTDTGIVFNGIPENYVKKEIKNKIEVSFTISEHQDSFDVSMTLFPNNNANIAINSTNRNFISYTGHITVLEEKSVN